MDDTQKSIAASGKTLREVREKVEGVFGDARGGGCMVMVNGGGVVDFVKRLGPEAATEAVAVLVSCFERQEAFGARGTIAGAIDELMKVGAAGAEAALPHLRVLQQELAFNASPEGQTKTIELAAATGIHGNSRGSRMPDAQWKAVIEGGSGIRKGDLTRLITTLEAGTTAEEAPDAPPQGSAAPPIRFRCEHCGKTVQAPHGAGGKRGTCPHCRQSCAIPTA